MSEKSKLAHLDPFLLYLSLFSFAENKSKNKKKILQSHSLMSTSLWHIPCLAKVWNIKTVLLIFGVFFLFQHLDVRELAVSHAIMYLHHGYSFVEYRLSNSDSSTVIKCIKDLNIRSISNISDRFKCFWLLVTINCLDLVQFRMNNVFLIYPGQRRDSYFI